MPNKSKKLLHTASTNLIRLITQKPYISLTLAFWFFFFAFYWVQGYTFRDGNVFAKSMATWADGAAHLTYVSAMAFRSQFPSTFPIYIDKPFIYPFVSDGLTAILVRLGLNIFIASNLTGLVLSLVLVYVLYQFYSTYTQSNSLAATSTNLFFFSGGLGFFYFFLDLIQNGFDTFPLTKEYTHLYQHSIEWINNLTGFIIPQRALLLGLIFGLYIFTQLTRLQRNQTQPIQLINAGLLLGFLPLVHPHTFLVVSFVSLFIFLENFLTTKSIKTALFFYFPAFIFATPIILFHLLPESSGFFRWHPGWLAKGGILGWLKFWLINWGLLIPLALLNLKTNTKKQLAWILPFALLFISANLFLFQPFDFDNTKIFIWVYLALTPLAAKQLHQLFSSTQLSRFVAILAFIILTLSGALDITRQLQNNTAIHMYNPNDLKLAQFVKQNTPPSSIFLTSPSHVHPIPTLTGRQIIMGFPGWLWTYGINYSTVETDVNRIYTGSPQALDLINQYHINYIVVSHHEIDKFDLNQDFFQNPDNFNQVYHQGPYIIYQPTQTR